MRPDIQDTRLEGSTGRIIYLGDVRRKRASRRRQQPDRNYLFALSLIALVGWMTWLTVVFTLDPARLLTYLAFFLPLAVALLTTGAIGDYAVEWRMGKLPSFQTALRRGALLAAIVVANLGLLAAHRWSVLVLGVSLLASTAVEAGAARRRL